MEQDINIKNGDTLLIIDVQNDFCPGGALPVKDGDRVIPVINEWIQKALDFKIPICASRDWHPLEHVSFREQGGNWPPHCLQDSPGAAFHKDLFLTNDILIITKGVRFDKDQNSAFDETGLETYFRRKNIEHLFICGLALDVCVMATVMDALELGFQVSLILNGTRSVNYQDGMAAIEKMKQTGAAVIGQYIPTEGERTEHESAHENEPLEPPICTKAPEWAEHERLEDNDQPCDDGRTGKIHEIHE